MTLARSDWRLALNRFGYGCRPGDGGRAGDPKEALLAELAVPRAAHIDNAELRSTRKFCKMFTPTKCARKWSATPPP